jgi:hypothetical protein
MCLYKSKDDKVDAASIVWIALAVLAKHLYSLLWKLLLSHISETITYRMFKHLYILLLLTLTGCVGLNVVVGTKQEYVGKSLGDKIGEAGGLVDTTITTAGVLRLWGEPTHRFTSNDKEYWTYRTDQLKWRGVIIWAIIPLPLLAPTGHQKVRLEFQDQLLTNYTIGYGNEHPFGLFYGGVGFKFLFGKSSSPDGW